MKTKGAPNTMQNLWSSRRKFFALVLLVLVAILVAVIVRNLPLSHSSGPTTAIRPTPAPHLAYSRQLQFLPDSLHPGQQVNLIWLAQPDRSQRSYGPTPIFCTFDLYGPFPTKAAAGQADNQRSSSSQGTPSSSKPTPAVAAPLLTVNNWDEQTRTSSLILPLTLAPGYYYYIWIASPNLDNGFEGTSGNDIVRVVAS